MPHKHHDATEQGKPDSENTARDWDWEGTVSNRNGDGAPSICRWRLEGAGGSVGDVDTWIGGREEDINAGCDENRTESTNALGEPLRLWGGSEEEADTKVPS